MCDPREREDCKTVSSRILKGEFQPELQGFKAWLSFKLLPRPSYSPGHCLPVCYCLIINISISSLGFLVNSDWLISRVTEAYMNLGLLVLHNDSCYFNSTILIWRSNHKHFTLWWNHDRVTEASLHYLDHLCHLVFALHQSERAFGSLKHLLTSAPILIFPHFDHPFILDVDVSTTGLCAVLWQVVDGYERAVAYATHALTKNQRGDIVLPGKNCWLLFGQLIILEPTFMDDSHEEKRNAKSNLKPKHPFEPSKLLRLWRVGERDVLVALKKSNNEAKIVWKRNASMENNAVSTHWYVQSISFKDNHFVYYIPKCLDNAVQAFPMVIQLFRSASWHGKAMKPYIFSNWKRRTSHVSIITMFLSSRLDSEMTPCTIIRWFLNSRAYLLWNISACTLGRPKITSTGNLISLPNVNMNGDWCVIWCRLLQ